MAKAFAAAGAQVDWIFSGRTINDYFDMEIFGDCKFYRGMTFATHKGRVQILKTLFRSNITQFWHDVKQINLDNYDFIINDFEPVTAWAAKLAGKKTIGISHQNAFFYDIPKASKNPLVDWFMRNFAPVTLPIGLHWHHFDQPILPPLVERSHSFNQTNPTHYLVYLPFCELHDILIPLREFTEYEFFVYQSVSQAYDDCHIHIRPFSREGFQQDLHACAGVICSAGFELPSEAIHLGKKILVQPVVGQTEQQSNAIALEQLGYGTATIRLDNATLRKWLCQQSPIQAHHYPDVAKALVDWLKKGGHDEDIPAMQQQLWKNTLPDTSNLIQT